MTFQNKLIFSDTETTGKDPKDFIQIIQSASVVTDQNYNIQDSMNVSCAPLPWVVPSPGAYLTHKKIETLSSSETHYQMMRTIHGQWKNWSNDNPALFITYNGHNFDEELYRRQFFWNLMDPFITNTNGNGRSDLLMLTRLVSQLFPKMIDFEINANGHPVCSLSSVAERIGIDTANAHDALSDCIFMIELLNFFHLSAEKLVTDFLSQGTKQGCTEFLKNTKVIGYRYQPFARFWTYPIKFVGINPTNQNEAICVDLNYPVDEVLNLGYEEIIKFLEKPFTESPFKVIRLNRSSGLADANEFDFNFECSMKELNSNAENYSRNEDWIEKVLVASTETEQRKWPKKNLIEETIYEKFFDYEDKKLFEQFHNSKSLEEQLFICKKFNDPRAKEFGYRILSQKNESDLPTELTSYYQELIRERWTSEGPWPSSSAYLKEAEELIEDRSSPSDLEIIQGVEQFIKNKIEVNAYG